MMALFLLALVGFLVSLLIALVTAATRGDALPWTCAAIVCAVVGVLAALAAKDGAE